MGEPFESGSAQLRPRWDAGLLVAVAVLALAAGGCRVGEAPSAPVAFGAALAQPADADDDIRGVGKWVSWRDQVEDPTITVPPHRAREASVQVQPGGHLVAAVDGLDRLRVWTIGEGGQLGRQVWDSAGLEALVMDFVWAGQQLVVCAMEGVVHRDVPYPMNPFTVGGIGDPWTHASKHTRTLVLEPRTGEVELLLEEGGGTLFADAAGETLAIGCATFDPGYAGDRPSVMDTHVYSMLERRWVGQFVADVGHRPEWSHQPMRLRQIVSDASGRHLVTLGWCEGERLPGETLANFRDAVAVLDLAGSFRFVTDGGWNRYSANSAGFPTLITTAQGRPAVATFLKPAQDKPRRLVAYAMTGQVLWQEEFGLKWGRLREATGRDPRGWEPVTLSPDGRILIVQDTGEHDWLQEGKRGWVWAYDLTTGQATALALLPRVAETCGWLDEHYLVAKLMPGPDGGRGDWGALHVPRPRD